MGDACVAASALDEFPEPRHQGSPSVLKYRQLEVGSQGFALSEYKQNLVNSSKTEMK